MAEDKLRVQMYTDGACSGNPGAGGYGCILRYKDKNSNWHEKELSAGYKHTTNNRMELMAVIAGLEALKQPCRVEITSDSKYFINAFKEDWISAWVKNNWRTSNKKRVKNVDLWMKIIDLMKVHDVELFWIKGHNGHEYNERCDMLAVNSAKSSDLLEDNYIEE